MFDHKFRIKHSVTITKRTDNPDIAKESGDCDALRPVLSNFFAACKGIHFSTFIAILPAALMITTQGLKNEFGFSRTVIPMNTRHSKFPNACFSGNPICPNSGKKFKFLGKSGGKNRSLRFVWVCPKSLPVFKTGYGICVYTCPDKNVRLYLGLPSDTNQKKHSSAKRYFRFD